MPDRFGLIEQLKSIYVDLSTEDKRKVDELIDFKSELSARGEPVGRRA